MKSMLYHFLISAILAVTTSLTWAQSSCLPEGITFTTQDEVDNFVLNYPDCSYIEGPVIIKGLNITDLSPLQGIRKVFTLTIDSTGLTSLSGLNNLDTIISPPFLINPGLIISNNPFLSNIDALMNMKRTRGLHIYKNESLTSIQPLSNTSISNYFSINENPMITEIVGFENIEAIGASINFLITKNSNLNLIDGFNALSTSFSSIIIRDNDNLLEILGFNNLIELPFESTSIIIQGDLINKVKGFSNLITCASIFITSSQNIEISAFEKVKNLKSIWIEGDSIIFLNTLSELDSLSNLNISASYLVNEFNFLNSLKHLDQFLLVVEHLKDFSGLNNLTTVNGKFHIGRISYDTETQPVSIESFSGLESLTSVSDFRLFNIGGLTNFEGLNELQIARDRMWLFNLSDLVSLHGLHRLKESRHFSILNCENLLTVEGLDSLTVFENIDITANLNLSFCSTPLFCRLISLYFDDILFDFNSNNCNSNLEVAEHCGIKITPIELTIKSSNDCLNSIDLEDDIEIIFEFVIPSIGLHKLIGTKNNKLNLFTLDDNSFIINPINLGKYWDTCYDLFEYHPSGLEDIIEIIYNIHPLTECPEVDVKIELPPAFSGCLTSNDINVRVTNFGTAKAINPYLYLSIPLNALTIELLSIPIYTQNGDTLIFQLNDLNSLANINIELVVRTDCDTFLLDRTLCLEAFLEIDNPCMDASENGSEVHVRAECENNNIVVFTLTNTGDAPTDVPHHYFIIEDEVVLLSDEFHLNVLESIQVEVDASGATMRMEATKLPNGMLTAAALEGCGGFTPGMINAFWLDRGESHYDIACRPVILAYDPNDKLAIPSGVGPAHLLAPNRPIEYIIRLQNTGTDTAFRVLLTDILPPELDVNTFRPGYASHDYTWEIRGLDTLDVLFFPIALPDSAASQEGSQGFFTFSMNQKPDLPHGTLVRNTASIIFDFNPPIVTNTVFHTIGTLSVHLDPPQHQGMVWLLHGNPTRDQAIFRAPVSIPGAKRFELYDLMGRGLRQEHFDGDEFLFQRGGLRSGMYLFRIADERGRQFTGKIVIAE
jgi:uncharacterized repeat protein (TIGR01451 family)